MAETDALFSSAIASGYDLYLRPLLFEPYAEDLARRAAALEPSKILEIAAGTGVVTDALLDALPGSAIVATDLNPAMLAVAAGRLSSERIQFLQADAQDLPFGEALFDMVVCQFGVMFFPDRVAAYRETKRVLKPGGTFLFNAWGRLAENDVSRIVADAAASFIGGETRNFVERVPFGYHDTGQVEADLRTAGFEHIAWEKVDKRSRAPGSRETAAGLCLGSPLRHEIEAHAPGRMEALIDAIELELAPLVRDGELDAPMSANVFTAR